MVIKYPKLIKYLKTLTLSDSAIEATIKNSRLTWKRGSMEYNIDSSLETLEERPEILDDLINYKNLSNYKVHPSYTPWTIRKSSDPIISNKYWQGFYLNKVFFSSSCFPNTTKDQAYSKYLEDLI